VPLKSPDQNRIHLIAHAGSSRADLRRLEFSSGADLIAFIRRHLEKPWRLTGRARFLEVEDDEIRGGRNDDAARVADLQGAIDDPHTLAIVAAKGGAYFSRILPHIDFSSLSRRRTPIWVLGFSEMTTLVNIIASYRCGRGLYWLCPNYVAWKVKPRAAAREALAEFWRGLPRWLTSSSQIAAPPHIPLGPIRGEMVRGKANSGRIRIIGGCISVLAAMLPGPLGRRLRPDGRWLAIEDVNEAMYRVDRHLATLHMAGWLDRIAGVLVGDFHTAGEQHTRAVADLLRFHLPRDRNIPIVTTQSFGHIWPMSPLPINRPLDLVVRGRDVTIHSRFSRAATATGTAARSPRPPHT
jgi:muramoyltetrapeptide carboxypeptidase